MTGSRGVSAVRTPGWIRHNVLLAPKTTLDVGGCARWFARVRTRARLAAALTWAQRHGVGVTVLSGGSNVIVADDGIDGLVLQPAIPGIAPLRRPGRSGDDGMIRVRVGAGVEWDRLVEWTVARGISGIEALSAIPGWVGAAPVQNVGAYGCEVADVIAAVHAVDRRDGSPHRIPAADCGFGYRMSRFKTSPDAWLITAVEFAFRRDARPRVDYTGLAAAVAAGGGNPAAPTPQAVRRAVIAVRAEKSMAGAPHGSPGDVNRRSAGSFFVNPTLSAANAADVARRAALLAPGDTSPMPRYPCDGSPGRVKVPAAWLIERAGMPRGYGVGAVGLSTRHTLAVVNRGGATARGLLDFAAHVAARVHRVFGVRLQLEPRRLGRHTGDRGRFAA
jgi:UDP-N-acetylmuramate dehydrogenase